MDSYQHSQPYSMYEHSHWSEDIKQSYIDHENEQLSDGKTSGSATPANMNGFPGSRRPSMLKVEDDFSPVDQMYHERRQEPPHPMRHYSQPHIPVAHPHGTPQPFMRIDPNFAASYAQPQQWPLSQSGTSTPTPAYSHVDPFGQPVQYVSNAGFSAYPQDPASAVSMSPQSSQGGWASATSTESAEQRGMVQSPTYRPVSPQLVLRPDGIRKKNARFEIPKERNLQTIDALILASTDDNEKKELKQQKRLLRNRQAALDSRQRKKSHTEKLEQEKKVHEKRMIDLEDAVTSLEATLNHERDQWLQQRHQYDLAIHQMQIERDDAIRTKTLETAELRRMNSTLKDLIRDWERQQSRPAGYTPASELNNMATDFSEFNFDDDWEDQFTLIDNDDLKMDESDSMQRQTTPRPSSSVTKPVDAKSEVGFSWNTFYMCLLFGAFIASTGNTAQDSKSSNAAPGMTSLPPLSDDYRAEAGNVLKAVLASGPDSHQEILPSRAKDSLGLRATTISGSEFSRMAGDPITASSSLEKLSATLTTPSRHQQLQAAFSLSASSYNHIMDPLGDLDNDADLDAGLNDSPKPTRLEQAFAELQAKQKQKEKAAGLTSKTDERSIFMERVPEKVLRDFKELVRQTNAGRNLERMEG